MRCPYCSDKSSKVTDSRVNDAGIRRRRECLGCQRRFTTHERVQSVPLMVSKRDGRREEFSREKMVAGLRKACAKRPVTARSIETMVDEIEAEFQQNGSGEVLSDVLGTAIMDRLKDLDTVAYIRFASVHRNFQEIESFEKAVRDLRDSIQQLPLLDMPPAPHSPSRGRRRAAPVPVSVPNGADNEDTGVVDKLSRETEEERLGEAVGTMGGE